MKGTFPRRRQSTGSWFMRDSFGCAKTVPPTSAICAAGSWRPSGFKYTGEPGHASLAEYSNRVVGLSARETEERLRVGLAIAQLPLLDRALAAGELCWSAVRELTRIATPDTESEWLVWAKGRRSRQIEQAVAGRRHGDSPKKRADPSLVTHVLRFEVRAETIALFRDLQAAVRADLGGAADDDALLFEIARRALGGPADEGRASYQVAVTRCDACRHTSIDAAGETTPVDPTVAEMMMCDAQQVGSVEHEKPAERPHMGATEQSPPPALADSSSARRRATQTVPPATRRHVMRRDHNRCVVPGCANHRFLDVHHLDLRSEGGQHDPERMAVLCGAHHRAVHEGALSIDGGATGGFVVRHADGTNYGAHVRPAEIEIAQQVFAALHHLGFKQSEARARVDAVLRAGAPSDLATFVGAALRSS